MLDYVWCPERDSNPQDLPSEGSMFTNFITWAGGWVRQELNLHRLIDNARALQAPELTDAQRTQEVTVNRVKERPTK